MTVIVFGSNVLDQFFDLADLPPRDKAIHLPTHIEAPGGKGANQAVAAAKAGAEVRFFGALGDGGHGRQMYKNLASYNIDVSGIEFDKDLPSGLATIFVDKTDGTHRIVVSQGANAVAKQSKIPDKLLTPQTTVLVQGELKMSETEALLARAKQHGSRTVMNLAPASEISQEGLRNLDIIILNEYEAETLGGRLNMQTEDKPVLAKEIYDRFELTTIITLGPDGAICYGKDGMMQVPSLPIKAVDTVGAGDAFVGFLCAWLDKGKSLEDALKVAAIAGSIACTKVGAQVALPTVDEIKQYLPENDAAHASASLRFNHGS